MFSRVNKSCWLAAALLCVAATTKAGLLQRPLSASQLQSNTVQAVQGDAWSRHQEFLEKICLDTIPLLPKFAPSMRYKALVDDEVIGLALAQAAFLRGTFLPALEAITNAPVQQSDSGYYTSEPVIPPSKEFLVWLLSDRARVEEVCEALKPQDNVGRIFRQWFELWQEDSSCRDKYWRLALACALAFQRPIDYQPEIGVHGSVNVKERYRYYRDAAEGARLCAPIAEMATWELLWVVDAPVPTSELEWARTNARLSRAGWGQAYSSIRYRMDRAMLSTNIYKNYTLAEIRQKGGICGDQAYFAAMTAKANGIPAMIITGQGDRGPHAWFGYEATTQDWNLKTGRYKGDKYPAGATTDPQTHERIKEPTLELLTDPQRRQPAWKTATRLVWLSEILNKNGQSKEAREALESAVAGSSRHLVACRTLCETLKLAAVPPVKIQEQFSAMRTTFARYPDTIATINQWEIDLLKSSTNTVALVEAMKRQYRGLKFHGNERTDLQIENITKQAELLVNAGNIDAADKVYRKAFQDPSRTITWFRTLLPSYVEFARANKRLTEAAKFVYSEMLRLPRSGSDPFAQKNYAGTERDVASVLEEIGRASLAKSLRQDALQLEKRATARAHP